MSALTLLTASLALLAPLVAAIDVPGGSSPTAGAVLLPDASNPVTAGKPYTITWTPKTDGCGTKLDIVLLKGPSAAQMSAQSYIVKGVDTTSAKYSWDVPTTLEPSTSDYGIEVICQDTQAYQYSTRFGLSNAAYSSSSASSASSATASGSGSAAVSSGASSTTAAGNSSTAATNSNSTLTTSTSRSTETPKYPITNNSTTQTTSGTSVATGANAAAATNTVTRTSTQSNSATSTTTAATTAATSSKSSAAAGLAHVKIGLGSLAALVAVAFATL